MIISKCIKDGDKTYRYLDVHGVPFYGEFMVALVVLATSDLPLGEKNFSDNKRESRAMYKKFLKMLEAAGIYYEVLDDGSLWIDKEYIY